jgi:hypothetical protein
MWENITEMYRRYSGTDEYFESGEKEHNIYFTSKYRGQQRIFSHCYLKGMGATTPSSTP